ncbi:SCO6880 family protein [Nocardioides terrisoli]|uniref:SCO6880 family protein n=1 Tax=Nocardioides terrisoli TaxID=3388267 RepID=UPI00287BB232|nr:SCO6880 family protein [Nocardioides marmorisolisilvae]
MTVYGEYMKDRTGWFFGLTGIQLALLVLSGIPAWIAVNAAMWGWLALWLPAWAGVALLVVVPVRGWSTAQWVGVLAAHGLGALMGWTTWQSKVAAGIAEDLDQADLPGVLAGVQIHDGPPYGHLLTRVAVIQHQAARTWAATARIEHPGLGLTEADTRDRMGAGLAELCEAATRTELVDLVAIQVRTVPDDGAEREDWVRLHRRADGPDLARRTNDQLSEQLMPASVRSEAFVSVVVGEDRISRSAKRAGGGIAGRARVLYGALSEIEARLLGPMGCTAVTWLDSASLAVAIRTGFEPGDRALLSAADVAARSLPQVATGVSLAAAGPSTASTELRQYSHGDWSSITDTVLLPEQGAVLGALAPVLVPSAAGERRSLTVFFAPMSTRSAEKITGREEMSAVTGAELRRRTGRLERAKERRTVNRVRSTDEKLARGRSLVRPYAAVSVTIPANWPTQEFGRRLDAAVRLAGYVPQRLDGAQDAAFAAASVPLGVGAPRRRGRR